MTSPTWLKVVGVAVFVRRSAGAWPVMVTVSWEVAGAPRLPMTGVPVTVAVLVMLPASKSAWLTTWVAVQVIEPPGARLVAVQAVMAPSLSSLTLTALIVTLPVLVTL